ncbi:fibronectin type III domain-containing protein [Paraliobacillus ryukyuensis]|uniref:fibronectin type III domain-containing protein n=1 Tax=Paraliobacillus ryukyuensis TaxID=200904 RepID=UPI001475AC06|nr:fibronectin type III domain-containing protein [Paraliobacillus ryukyuensis]
MKFISTVNQHIHRLHPNAPVNLTAPNETATTVDLTWDAVSQADGYKVYQDGAEVAQVTDTTYQVTGLTASTSYDFYVTALNSDYGTESEASTTVTATTTA